METLLLSAATLGATVALFVVLYRVHVYEWRTGQRVVCARQRDWVDRMLERSASHVAGAMRRLGQLVSRPVARRQETSNAASVTTLLRHATRTPLTVTQTDNHLSKMQQHKNETALTALQKQKLKHKTLEELF